MAEAVDTEEVDGMEVGEDTATAVTGVATVVAMAVDTATEVATVWVGMDTEALEGTGTD
jgi:hypothetical protein